MEFNNLSNAPFCDLRVGIIYYFYDDPQKCKRKIKNLFKDFCILTNPKFLYYRHNKCVGLDKLKINGLDYFTKMIDETDFNETQHLILTDATKKSLHNVRVEMVLRTIKEEFVIKTPNWIYFEFKKEQHYIEILQFIKQAFYDMTYYYSCCNYVIGQNDHLLPKSGAEAIKKLKHTKCINDSYSILLNQFFIKDLENKVDGPNLIQVLSKKLYEEIGFKTIIEKCNNEHLSHEFGEDYVILRISKNEFPTNDEKYFEDYKAMYNLLNPIISEIKKPEMYWKEEEWEMWRRRFD